MSRRLVIAVTILLIGAIGIFAWIQMRDTERDSKENNVTSSNSDEMTYHQGRTRTTSLSSQKSLEEYLKEHSIKGELVPDDINWDNDMVVAVTYQAPTPGYAIQAQLNDSGDTVNVRIQLPPLGCAQSQVITQIYDFVLMERSEGEPLVHVEAAESKQDCFQ